MVDRSEFLPQSGLRLASGRRRQAHDDAGHDEVGTYMLVVLVISRQQYENTGSIDPSLFVVLYFYLMCEYNNEYGINTNASCFDVVY